MDSRTFPTGGAEALRLLLTHWRLVAVSGLFQLVSGFVSMTSIQPKGDPFLDAWLGAAVAGPFGLAVGLAWHLANRDRRRSTHWLFVGFLALCAVMVPVLGWPAVLAWE